MRSQAIPYDELDLVSRLQQDRRFALEFLDVVLRTGKGSDVAEAFVRLALALDDVALPPEAVDPDEARVVLERIHRLLLVETREIVLSENP